MKKNWKRAALVGVLALGAGVAAFALRTREAAPTATATRGDVSLTLDATGTLEAAVFVEIGPPSARDVWQYNLTWLIPEGSRVKAGDVVARFDATQLEDRLREHRAELETTLREKEKEERNLEVSLRQLALDLVEAEGEVEKVALESSVPDELVPALDRAQTRLKEQLGRRRVEFLKQKIAFEKELVKAKLELLDVKRTRAEQKIAYYDEAKNKFNVKAPIAGVVIPIPKRNGDRWEVGEGVWMLAKILRIADDTTLRVEAQVLEVDASRVAAGQPVNVRIDALPGRVMKTRVNEVGRIVRARSLQDPGKVIDAYMPLEGIDSKLMRPGMSVRVEIETARLADRVTVPCASVRTGPEGPAVEVLDNGRAERRPVVLGPRQGDRVVIESGLTGGETIAAVPTGGPA